MHDILRKSFPEGVILETRQAFYIPRICSIVCCRYSCTVRNTSPDSICVNLSNVESDSGRYFVRILTLVIFGEFGLRRFEECRFSGIVQAENEYVEVVLLRPGLVQPREQRVHIAACTSFVKRIRSPPRFKYLVPAYALPLVLRSHGVRHSNVGVKVGQDRGRLGVEAFNVSNVTSPQFSFDSFTNRNNSSSHLRNRTDWNRATSKRDVGAVHKVLTKSPSQDIVN